VTYFYSYYQPMTWNPDQYHKFQSERSAPFYDLLALVEKRPNLKIIDLGCGTGELTKVLAESLPNSDVTGLDSSPQMLEKAGSHQTPNLRFEQEDLSALTGSWDLIFSNAAIQWVNNHKKLIPIIYSKLNPGGQICVQIPSNHNHISHVLIRETADEEPFKSILGGYKRIAPVLQVEEYANMFFELGAENITVFEKVYPHVLENSDEIVEWISGTAMLPYFERLGEHKTEFVEVIRKKLKAALPENPVFYPFKRILFSATKPK